MQATQLKNDDSNETLFLECFAVHLVTNLISSRDVMHCANLRDQESGGFDSSISSLSSRKRSHEEITNIRAKKRVSSFQLYWRSPLQISNAEKMNMLLKRYNLCQNHSEGTETQTKEKPNQLLPLNNTLGFIDITFTFLSSLDNVMLKPHSKHDINDSDSVNKENYGNKRKDHVEKETQKPEIKVQFGALIFDKYEYSSFPSTGSNAIYFQGAPLTTSSLLEHFDDLGVDVDLKADFLMKLKEVNQPSKSSHGHEFISFDKMSLPKKLAKFMAASLKSIGGITNTKTNSYDVDNENHICVHQDTNNCLKLDLRYPNFGNEFGGIPIYLNNPSSKYEIVSPALLPLFLNNISDTNSQSLLLERNSSPGTVSSSSLSALQEWWNLSTQNSNDFLHDGGSAIESAHASSQLDRFVRAESAESPLCARVASQTYNQCLKSNASIPITTDINERNMSGIKYENSMNEASKCDGNNVLTKILSSRPSHYRGHGLTRSKSFSKHHRKKKIKIGRLRTK